MSERLGDLCDHEESVDLLIACEGSERKVGIGKAKLSVGTGGRDPLMAPPGLSKINITYCWSALGSFSTVDHEIENLTGSTATSKYGKDILLKDTSVDKIVR